VKTNIPIKKIIKAKKREIQEIQRSFDEPLIKAAAFSVGGEFRSIEVTIQQAPLFPVLVELKPVLFPRMLRIENFDLLKIVKSTQLLDPQTAIIVPTDEKHLGGNTSWVNLVKYNTEAPILRRDFFIHPAQMYQTKAIGADGIILDPYFMPEKETNQLLEANYAMGLEAFVEIGEDTFPGFLNSEFYQGLIVEPKEAKIQLEQLSSSRQNFPADKIVLLKSLPGNLEEMAMIREAGFQGLLLSDEIWQPEKNIFEILHRISNWTKILGKSTDSQ